MSENVFILGAGASKEAGAPLIKNFLSVADDLRNDKNLGNYEEDFDNVFNARSKLQAVHSKSNLNIGNIESLFAAFEMGELIKKFPGIESESIPQLIVSIKKLIMKTLEMTVKFKYQDKSIMPDKPYNSLARQIRRINDEKRKNICSIITFNYDLALDYALHFNSVPYDYYLDESSKPNYVPLLKLHGSLNWIKCPRCKKIVPWYIKDFFNNFHYNYLKEEMELTIDLSSKLTEGYFEHCREKIKNELPVIVPPTWNKTSYHNDLSPVWKRAANELSDAKNIFISGYSLTPSDEFFRYLYALGSVSDTVVKRFWVFDPDEDNQVEKRFSKLLGQGIEDFRFQRKTFFDLLSELSNLKF